MFKFPPLFLTALLLAACSGREDAPPTVTRQKAVNQLETAFSAADKGIKRQINATTAALKEKKYDAAFFALESVKSDRRLTADQLEAVRVSMQVLQQALAEAIVRGDSNAIRTVQMIRGIQ
jgi:hypothetical protein